MRMFRNEGTECDVCTGVENKKSKKEKEKGR